MRVPSQVPVADAHADIRRRFLSPRLLAVAVVALALVAIVPTVGPRLVGGGPIAVSSPSATPVRDDARLALATGAPTETRQDTPLPAVPSPVPSPTSVPSPRAIRPTPALAVPSPTPKRTLPGGTIVFVSENPADPGLFAISTLGQNLKRLTTGAAHNPACSPSGDTVAFESNRTGVSLIYALRLGGSATPETVTAGSGADQLAAWNPSGKSIAFARARPDNTAIFTIDLGDHQEHQLTPGTGGDWRMSYSPDGKQIVFTSTRTGNNDLWLTSADGKSVRQLTRGPGDKRDPSWSPDGKWIAFRSDRDGHRWDLYKVSPTDGQIIRLTSDSADKGFPNWSPDSRWILFTANRGGTPEVYGMPVEGGDWIPITSAPTMGGGATWCR